MRKADTCVIVIQTTIIADQQGTVVDIRNPLDAINVATFIAFIVLEHAPRMRALFAHSDTCTMPDDLKEYLADGRTTPIRKAQSMTQADGAWKGRVHNLACK